MKYLRLVIVCLFVGRLNSHGDAFSAFFKELDDKNYDSFMKSAQKPVLVKFYASWCGACRSMEDVDAKVAQAFEKKIAFAALDIEQNQKLAQALNVQNIPTYFIYKGGKLVNTAIGGMPQMVYEAMLHKLAS